MQSCDDPTTASRLAALHLDQALALARRGAAAEAAVLLDATAAALRPCRAEVLAAPLLVLTHRRRALLHLARADPRAALAAAHQALAVGSELLETVPPHSPRRVPAADETAHAALDAVPAALALHDPVEADRLVRLAAHLTVPSPPPARAAHRRALHDTAALALLHHHAARSDPARWGPARPGASTTGATHVLALCAGAVDAARTAHRAGSPGADHDLALALLLHAEAAATAAGDLPAAAAALAEAMPLLPDPDADPRPHDRLVTTGHLVPVAPTASPDPDPEQAPGPRARATALAHLLHGVAPDLAPCPAAPPHQGPA